MFLNKKIRFKISSSLFDIRRATFHYVFFSKEGLEKFLLSTKLVKVVFNRSLLKHLKTFRTTSLHKRSFIPHPFLESFRWAVTIWTILKWDLSFQKFFKWPTLYLEELKGYSLHKKLLDFFKEGLLSLSLDLPLSLSRSLSL